MKAAFGYLIGAAIAASCFAAEPASAGVLAALTRSTPTQATDNEKTLLPLDDAGDTSFIYHSVVGIGGFTFNAECIAEGPAGSYVTINITVDNHSTDPRSARESAFCSPTGTLVSASRLTTFTYQGGHPHTIRVYATGVGTTSWRLNSSLLLIQE